MTLKLIESAEISHAPESLLRSDYQKGSISLQTASRVMSSTKKSSPNSLMGVWKRLSHQSVSVIRTLLKNPVSPADNIQTHYWHLPENFQRPSILLPLDCTQLLSICKKLFTDTLGIFIRKFGISKWNQYLYYFHSQISRLALQKSRFFTLKIAL